MEKEKKITVLLKIIKQLPLLICFIFLIFGNKLNLSVKEYEVLSYFIVAISICYVLITAKDIYKIITIKIMKK